MELGGRGENAPARQERPKVSWRSGYASGEAWPITRPRNDSAGNRLAFDGRHPTSVLEYRYNIAHLWRFRKEIPTRFMSNILSTNRNPYRCRFWPTMWAAISLIGPFNAWADVKVPAIFGDHMVLQERSRLPIWGWASPGEHVTVSFSGQQMTTVTAGNGTWRVDLDPVDPNSHAGTLTITGMGGPLVFTDVLVGDVWIASGQSNMEFGIQEDKRGKQAIGNATDAQIRLFFVPWATALEPRTDIGPGASSNPLNGKWLVCTPETMGADWAWQGFSAVGYYFAKEIRQATGHPIGMIAAYRGATPAQAWTSIAGLEKEETLAHYVAQHQTILDNFTEAEAAYSKEHAAYEIHIKEWKAATQTAKNSGQPLPADSAPKEPMPPDGGFTAPGNLFNGMIAPLIPYAIRGVLWYQGESNANSPAEACEYAFLFPTMISDWREHWRQGNFPFLFVQLPNFKASAKMPSEGNWPWLRDSQLKALSLPNTGMAVTIDIGDADAIHPPDKLYVGQRLALVARHNAYKEDLVYSGPIYDSMAVEGNKIRIRFRNLGSGLTLGSPPPGADGKVSVIPKELTGFGIAGTDQKFIWAKAIVDGDSVIVSSDKIENPVAVRYDWGDNPHGNLYDKENLPASPFRTDSWPPRVE
jgi:sialate O-acetylesterase